MSGLSFYPSVVVHLAIRLDTSFRYQTASARSVADLVAPKPAGATSAPLFTLVGDGFSRLNALVPMDCSVELSSYRKGGKFSFKLPFRDFPIDVRLIKAGRAEIHAGTVPAASFARGIEERQPSNVSDLLRWHRSSILATSDSTLLISGPIDKPKLHLGKDGADISFEGRDNVSIFADVHIDPKMLSKVNIDQPINRVVDDILRKHPLVVDGTIKPFKTVVCNAVDWPNGVIRSPGTKDNVTRVRRKDAAVAGAGGAQMHPGADPTASISFWDLIIQYCSLVAAVPYFLADGRLCIRPAIMLHDWEAADRTFDPAFQYPFAGNIPRLIANGRNSEEIGYRRMVFGRNIEDLTFERKTAGVKARVVEVSSIDDDAEGRGAEQKLIKASYPTKAINEAGKVDKAKVSAVTPEGDKAATDVLRVTVHGIRSKTVLGEIAKGIFNEVMHQEISGHCQTKDLTSFGGDDADPDLLRMRPGDPVQILTDAAALNASAPHVSEILDSARRSFEEEVAEVKQKIANDENFARAIVATSRNLVLGLQNTFRVSAVKFDFTMQGESPSASVSFDFQNYVDAQYHGINKTDPIPPKKGKA